MLLAKNKGKCNGSGIFKKDQEFVNGYSPTQGLPWSKVHQLVKVIPIGSSEDVALKASHVNR